MKNKTFVIIDIETTRTAELVINDPKPPICAISAMAIDFNTLEPIEKFSQLILFNKSRAQPDILELIGYDEARWVAHAEHPLKAFQNFKKFLQPYAWYHQVSKRGMDYNTVWPVGHNVAHFDIPVLLQWCKALKEAYNVKNTYLPLSYQPRLDTCELANGWAVRNNHYPPSFRLPHLCDFWGLEVEKNHNPDNDVTMTYQLLKLISPMLGWKDS